MLCVAANLGPGLRYDTITGLLSVRLSANPGNATVFGSDDGVYTPSPDADPDPATGRKTIAGLPARAVAALQGGAGGMAPFGSPYAMEYGVANRMDIILLHTHVLADGIALNRTASQGQSISIHTDNPAAIAWEDISSLQLPSLLVDAGTRVSPTGRQSGAPSALLTPDGGWFGFYALQFSPMTLQEALVKLAARSVAMVIVLQDGLANSEANLAAAIATVIQVGAQDWAMVSVPAYYNDGSGDFLRTPLADWVDDVIGAGLVPVIDLFDEERAVDPWTPGELTATGAQWVRALSPQYRPQIPLSRITDLVGAGLQVSAMISGRHSDVQQVYAAGARAIISPSPVYSRGARGEPGDLDYRKTTVIPGLQARTTMEGDLVRRTDTGYALADIGYARQGDVGRYFPPGYGWEEGVGNHYMAQLLGELCPIAQPWGYRIRIRFRVAPEQVTPIAGSNPKIGIFWGAPNDDNIEWADAEGPLLTQNGYWFNVLVGMTNTGRITLAKVNDSVYTVLDNSLQFSTINYGDWISFDIEVVDESTIRLSASHSSDPGVLSVEVEDSDHRGPYLYYAWEDDDVPPGNVASQYGHGYAPWAAFATTAPMIELMG